MSGQVLEPEATAVDDPLLDEQDVAPVGESTGVAEAARRPSLPRRIGRRIIRRPSRWLNSPWPTERIVQYLTALILVGGATFAVLQVVHLDLVFSNNTPTGGDMGAHVMAPAFLRDELLPNGQLTGWSMYWYAGFPMYRFYMVVPALMIVGLNALWIPYGIAFKIVAILGLVTLPFCCWAFGRLARFRYPIPELMALAGMLFLFDESFSIYGGNVKSTMAGEFSFSIALSLAVLGLGLFARGLQVGKYRSWSAIVLALAIVSHGVVAIFVVLAAILLWLVYMDKTRFRYGLGVLAGTALLSAFWVVPFLFNHQYMTDMKYGFRPDGPTDSFWKMFFQYPPFWDIVVNGLAIIGFGLAIVRRQLVGVWLGLLCLALMALTYITRDSLPVIGLLWNPRILPFLYITRLLLMMVGIVELVHYVLRNWQHVRALSPRTQWISGVATAATVGVTILIVVLFIFREVPGGHYETKNGKSVYSWGIAGFDPITLTPTSQDAVADGWTRYNFEGYEGRPSYAEYKALIDTMAEIGADPAYGCGRAIWENNEATGSYGTTMALMLLPHWTDGCITSMEGLYFEASGTTPYHFLTASAVSSHSSDPVRELRYDDGDTAKGVPYMQSLGVNYLMVFTAAAKNQAEALTTGTNPQLTRIAESGPWKIFQVNDSPLVEPLTTQPVVVNARGGDQRERHLELGTSWFQNRDEWAAMPADGGPPEWQRIDVHPDAARNDDKSTGQPGHKVDIVVPTQPIQPVALPKVNVSNVQLGEQDLSFDVDQIGVPTLVKVSYFPNWQVEGAEGPWRVGPNMMVVVPTSTHVRLHFERSTLDDISYVLTLIGIVLLIFFRVHGDVRYRSESPFDPAPAALLPAVVGPTTGVAAAGEPPGDPSDDDWPWLARPPDDPPPFAGATDPTTPLGRAPDELGLDTPVSWAPTTSYESDGVGMARLPAPDLDPEPNGAAADPLDGRPDSQDGRPEQG